MVRPRGTRTKHKKYVKMSTEISAYLEKHALESTNVGSEKKFCHLANAASQSPAMAKARTLLNLKIFEANLADHPDKEPVNFIINGIYQGVDIGYKGPQRSIVSDNWPYSLNNHDKVSEAIQAHIVKCRVAGPWAHPQFDNFVSSLWEQSPKSNSIKVQVIQDLSFPSTSGVNSGIDSNEFSLKYIKIDDIIQKYDSFNSPCYLAFSHIIAHPDC